MRDLELHVAIFVFTSNYSYLFVVFKNHKILSFTIKIILFIYFYKQKYSICNKEICC